MSVSFFALFDDIALLMDDVAAMTKVATKKTAGILGDDLAVNANKAAGFTASRELPVLWEITKGSFINKLIILPIAFLMSAFVPWLIIPILMLGGVYLAYEGAEKIYEYFFHKQAVSKNIMIDKKERQAVIEDEKEKIKSAIFIDFILSIEIIIIALSTVTDNALSVQIMVVSFIAILATIGVYGIVAFIVRMDDFGYTLIALDKGSKHIVSKLGHFLVASLPKVIKMLTVVGTVAMLLVSGEIFLHNIHTLHQMLHAVPEMLSALIIGLIIGSIAVLFMHLLDKIRVIFKGTQE
jgi:predicted DNA repair protein MutK